MAQSTDSNGVPSTDYLRLPTNVIPNHYFIHLRPDLTNYTFCGSETINVEVREETNKIVINSLDIEIQSASFVVAGKKERIANKIEIKNDEQVAIISFPETLALGAGELKLKFTGVIGDSADGCYRTKYTTPDGEVRYGLSTQFEPIFCRKAFPSFDEPSLKAKFDLTLVAPKNRVALSNMPVVEEKDDEIDSTYRVLKFATTPIMSSYLLCYVIGEYEFIEKKTSRGIDTRVYTPVGKTDQGKFALDVAVRCLDYFEDFFKIPYPLPKMDLIAISDFSLGAMENWGLVTYREFALLFDEQKSKAFTKERIALTVCHELAHQWFGNLVTMKWWDNLWLNEGFATFMEFLSVSHLLPEMNVWENFPNDCLISAMNLDSKHGSHPVQVPIKNANEIDEIFDEISYEKGSSVIRMLYDYLGAEDFQKGLHLYLTRWSYKNTETQDLWTAFEETSGKPVCSLMNCWTLQKGFPWLHVSSRQDGSNRILKISQEKFSMAQKLTEEEKQSKWLIPISVVSQNNPKAVKILIEEKTQEFVLENVESNEWVKLNSCMQSFVRVDYSKEMFEQFASSIADKSLNPMDRLNLQDDVFSFVLNGRVAADTYLKFLESFIDEDKYIVWTSIISNLNQMNCLLAYTDYEQVFHIFVRKILSKIQSKVGFKAAAGEDHQISLLRSAIMSILVSCQEPQILKEAKIQFEAHLANIVQIDPNLCAPYFRSIVTNDCDDKTFENFFKLFRETDLQEEKNVIIQSMGATKDLARLQRVMDLACSGELPKQDKVGLLVRISRSNTVGRDFVWNYFKENQQELVNDHQSSIFRMVKGITENYASEERLQETSAHFAANPIKGLERPLQQSLENIRSNIDFLSRNSVIIKNYLTSSNSL